MLKFLKILHDTDENKNSPLARHLHYYRCLLKEFVYYLFLAYAFLLGASSDIILSSSGVGSVSLSNLPLTRPLGASIHIELPS